MARSSAGGLFSGLLVGAAIGAGVALLAASRANVAVAGAPGSARPKSGPTPFEPANIAIGRAREFVSEVRTQMRLAMAEGRATAAQTRAELTARFEAAKHAQDEGDKK
jgi:hypothetical protein